MAANGKVAVLFLTPACNMHCDFCGAQADFDSMDHARASRLLHVLKGSGVESIVLGGGEPFLWGGGLFSLARKARQLGLLVQVGSNGTLAPQEDSLLDGFDRWVLPLEGVSRGLHDQMRHFEGGHQEKVMLLMERLNRNSVPVTVSSLVTQENFDGLLDVGNFLAAYQRQGGLLHAWHLYKFLPVGRGGSLHRERFLTKPGVFESVAELLKKRFLDLRIYARPDMYHSQKVSFHWEKNGQLESFWAQPVS